MNSGTGIRAKIATESTALETRRGIASSPPVKVPSPIKMAAPIMFVVKKANATGRPSNINVMIIPTRNAAIEGHSVSISITEILPN